MRSPSGVIYAVNSNGPRTDPCGTPNGTEVGGELSLSIRTSCFLSAKYDLSQSSAAPVTPNLPESTQQNAMVNCVECCGQVKQHEHNNATIVYSRQCHCALSTKLFQLSGFADTPIASARASCSHACRKLAVVPRHAQQLSK